ACSLPLSQPHGLDSHSRRAAQLLERLLDNYSSDNRLHQWLLNFSHMTTGGFPDRVPPRYRIDSPFTAAFFGAKRAEAEHRFAPVAFAERARDFGVDTFNTGRGVAVEDFDGDGYLDIITAASFEGLKYFKNDRGRGFIDRTAESGLAGVRQPFII